MKKILILLMGMLSFLCVNTLHLGTAEAARVAVLPLQVDETKIERAADFTSYYWDIMVDGFQYPDYELMDDEKILDALPEAGLKSFDKDTMIRFAASVDAEIVVAMRLDKLSEEAKYIGLEHSVKYRIDGEFASYNRLTDKYFKKKFHEDYQVDDGLTFRNDWQQMMFEDITKRYVYRTKKSGKK